MYFYGDYFWECLYFTRIAETQNEDFSIPSTVEPCWRLMMWSWEYNDWKLIKAGFQQVEGVISCTVFLL